jgi:hypothetical protein
LPCRVSATGAVCAGEAARAADPAAADCALYSTMVEFLSMLQA